MESVNEKLTGYRAFIESFLEGFLPEGEESEKTLEAMRYSLLGGGKRVRGILTLASCELVCGNYELAAPAAAAVEMIHAYSLIHDDLPCMDDDSLRRGKPSCHIAFGEAVALLAGDALLTLAFEALSYIRDPLKARTCVSLLAKAGGYRGMVRGQELDGAAEGIKHLGLDKLNEMHSLKTGALFSAAAGMGAVLGNGNENEIGTARQYAEKIGLAFQIIDDILDVTEDEKTLGKLPNSDMRANKSTYITVCGIDKSKLIANELTDEAAALIDGSFGDRAGFLCQFAEYLKTRIN